MSDDGLSDTEDNVQISTPPPGENFITNNLHIKSDELEYYVKKFFKLLRLAKKSLFNNLKVEKSRFVLIDNLYLPKYDDTANKELRQFFSLDMVDNYKTFDAQYIIASNAYRAFRISIGLLDCLWEIRSLTSNLSSKIEMEAEFQQDNQLEIFIAKQLSHNGGLLSHDEVTQEASATFQKKIDDLLSHDDRNDLQYNQYIQTAGSQRRKPQPLHQGRQAKYKANTRRRATIRKPRRSTFRKNAYASVGGSADELLIETNKKTDHLYNESHRFLKSLLRIVSTYILKIKDKELFESGALESPFKQSIDNLSNNVEQLINNIVQNMQYVSDRYKNNFSYFDNTHDLVMKKHNMILYKELVEKNRKEILRKGLVPKNNSRKNTKNG